MAINVIRRRARRPEGTELESAQGGNDADRCGPEWTDRELCSEVVALCAACSLGRRSSAEQINGRPSGAGRRPEHADRVEGTQLQTEPPRRLRVGVLSGAAQSPDESAPN